MRAHGHRRRDEGCTLAAAPRRVDEDPVRCARTRPGLMAREERSRMSARMAAGGRIGSVPAGPAATAARTDAPRAALSFAAAYLGWALGIAWFVGREVHGGGFGRVTDLEAMCFWSGLFVFASWLVAMLPLALRLDRDAVLLAPLVAPLFGAL